VMYKLTKIIRQQKEESWSEYSQRSLGNMKAIIYWLFQKVIMLGYFTFKVGCMLFASSYAIGAAFPAATQIFTHSVYTAIVDVLAGILSAMSPYFVGVTLFGSMSLMEFISGMFFPISVPIAILFGVYRLFFRRVKAIIDGYQRATTLLEKVKVVTRITTYYLGSISFLIGTWKLYYWICRKVKESQETAEFEGPNDYRRFFRKAAFVNGLAAAAIDIWQGIFKEGEIDGNEIMKSKNAMVFYNAIQHCLYNDGPKDAYKKFEGNEDEDLPKKKFSIQAASAEMFPMGSGKQVKCVRGFLCAKCGLVRQNESIMKADLDWEPLRAPKPLRCICTFPQALDSHGLCQVKCFCHASGAGPHTGANVHIEASVPRTFNTPLEMLTRLRGCIEDLIEYLFDVYEEMTAIQIGKYIVVGCSMILAVLYYLYPDEMMNSLKKVGGYFSDPLKRFMEYTGLDKQYEADQNDKFVMPFLMHDVTYWDRFYPAVPRSVDMEDDMEDDGPDEKPFFVASDEDGMMQYESGRSNRARADRNYSNKPVVKIQGRTIQGKRDIKQAKQFHNRPTKKHINTTSNSGTKTDEQIREQQEIRQALEEQHQDYQDKMAEKFASMRTHVPARVNDARAVHFHPNSYQHKIMSAFDEEIGRIQDDDDYEAAEFLKQIADRAFNIVKDIGILRETNKRLQDSVVCLQEENSNLIDQVDSVETKMSTLNDSNAQLESADNQILILKSENQSLVSENLDLVNKVDGLETVLSNKIDEINAGKLQFEEQATILSKLRAQAEEQFAKLKRYIGFEAENIKLKEQIDNHRKEINEALQKLRHDNDVACKGLQARIREVEQTRDKALREVERLSNELNKTKSKVAENKPPVQFGEEAKSEAKINSEAKSEAKIVVKFQPYTVKTLAEMNQLPEDKQKIVFEYWSAKAKQLIDTQKVRDKAQFYKPEYKAKTLLQHHLWCQINKVLEGVPKCSKNCTGMFITMQVADQKFLTCPCKHEQNLEAKMKEGGFEAPQAFSYAFEITNEAKCYHLADKSIPVYCDEDRRIGAAIPFMNKQKQKCIMYNNHFLDETKYSKAYVKWNQGDKVVKCYLATGEQYKKADIRVLVLPVEAPFKTMTLGTFDLEHKNKVYIVTTFGRSPQVSVGDNCFAEKDISGTFTHITTDYFSLGGWCGSPITIDNATVSGMHYFTSGRDNGNHFYPITMELREWLLSSRTEQA
jgi:hypothetical protein